MTYPDAPQGTDAPQHPQSPYAMPAAEPKNGLALAAMIVGIVSLVTLILVWFMAIPVGIVAIVLGVVARREASKRAGLGRGQATAAIICGSIALVLSIVVVALMVLVVVSGTNT